MSTTVIHALNISLNKPAPQTLSLHSPTFSLVLSCPQRAISQKTPLPVMQTKANILQF